MLTKSAAGKELLNDAHILALLFPLAVYLRTAGISKQKVLSLFLAAYRQANAEKIRRIHRIGHSAHYENIVALWMRDKRFLDGSGRPKALSLGGTNSFSSLVRSVSRGIEPKAAVSLFTRYGTVRRLRKGTYALITPYFAVSNPKSTAFEPYAHFMSEASTTLGRILRRDRSSDLRPFWRMVDTSNISDAAARRFMAYIRERSQTFLEEVNDWLDAIPKRSITASGKQRIARRVGIGLFSIYSDFGDWRQSSA